MAKFDVEAAYRNVPVQPCHRVPLGMKWRDQFYVDLVLLFSLRSAPFIFNSIADMVEWSIPTRFQTSSITWMTSLLPVLLSPSSVHITWLLLGKSVNGLVYLCILPNVWALLRCLSSWGWSWELDSFNQVARLPQEKLLVLKNLISSWLLRKWCNTHKLESLIGHLHHFLRRMIDLLCCFQRRDHPVHLNREFHLYLRWWHQFLEDCHGVGFWLLPELLPETDVEVSSDAAGKFGYGAYMKGHWFAGPWVPSQQLQSNAYKELFPIL